MQRKVLGLAALAALVAVVATAMAPAQAKNDEAADWQRVQTALQAVQAEQNDENFAALLEATDRYLKNHAEGQHRLQAINMHLQVREIRQDWRGILSFAEANADESNEVAKTLITAYAGIAHANLGNEEEARAAVAALREVQNPQLGRFPQQMISRIEQALRFQPGATPPAFTLPKVDGDGRASLSDYAGSYVIIDFWASWCGPCHAVMDRELKPLWEQYGDEKFEIVSVGVNWREDTAERQRQFAAQRNYNWTKLFDADGETAQAYGIAGIPFLVLIDPEGKVVEAGGGAQIIPTVKERLTAAFGNDSNGEGEEE